VWEIECTGFAKKISSLQSKTRSVLHAFCTLTWIKQIFFLLLFASNFSLSTKAKLIVRIFALFCLQKFFVSLPIFSFRFKAKWNKRFFASFHHTRYRHKKVKDQPWYFSSILYKLSQNFTLSFFALKFSLLFRFVFASFHFFASKRKKICFRFASKQKWWQFFASVSLRSEKDGSFLLPFHFISLRSENDGSFLLLFRFVFASFHFRFASKRKWRRTLVGDKEEE
jgi:hypothetical protein